MAFAPDGRLFIAEQNGQLRVVHNGTLPSAPFVSLAVNASGERGLLGIAFDPAFAENQFVYVYYTATTPVIHNRVSRFTASGNVAMPGSEVVLVDLEPLSAATNHNGGAIHFGPDGTLYIAVGDNANGANSQTLGNRLGHSDGCAISGGAFHQASTAALPAQFAGSYFFADFCGGWINRRTPAGAIAGFADGINGLVDLQVSADGALY
jgi:glucose/arabinose dehydrogenase